LPKFFLSRPFQLLFAIAWLTLVTGLLIIPGSDLPKRSWFDVVYLDKWVHVGLFSMLVVLWVIALGKKYPIEHKMFFFWGICIAAILYGTGMELVQKYFVSNRSFDLKDILADAVGAVIGVIFCRLRYIKK
jgi:hypothetical protein